MKLRKASSETLNRWSSGTWTCLVIGFTAATFVIHGFHPYAEDGGIYTAGVYLELDPSLFPHDPAFVRAPFAYSQFAWFMASISRALHLNPGWTFVLMYVATIAATFCAAKMILRHLGFDDLQQGSGVALLAVWWTLPVAGTSLSIADPYLTARSFSTPLSLFALAFAMQPWKNQRGRWKWRPIACSILFLLVAATMHELMAFYALAFVVLYRMGLHPHRPKLYAWFALGTFSAAFVLQAFARPESPAFILVEKTRGYWYLSRWRWFEVLGLLGPLAIFALLLRSKHLPEAVRVLCGACVAAGSVSAAVWAIFAHEDAPLHIIARLQPLRLFVLLYILMSLLLGAWGLQRIRLWAATSGNGFGLRGATLTGALVFAGLGFTMFLLQRHQFSSSRHMEFPNGTNEPNAWVRAFVWIRNKTSVTDQFALDANYINISGEDGHTFRSIARRSVLPDQSKDGGEAAVNPALAAAWKRGMDAQTELDTRNDMKREQALGALGVNWVILGAGTQTELSCPYRNEAVEVCRLDARRKSGLTSDVIAWEDAVHSLNDNEKAQTEAPELDPAGKTVNPRQKMTH